jgi:hypothetical protein
MIMTMMKVTMMIEIAIVVCVILWHISLRVTLQGIPQLDVP